MSDLISREEVLRAIITSGEVEPDLGYTHLHKVIENLPSAEPKWIPVKERLPEEDTDVLCTIHFEGKHLAPLAREWFVDICHCRDGEWYTYLDDDATKDAWFDVVAWMPLPGCYEGEQE